MKALVVYESMYGKTREVAEGVAEGLRSASVDTELMPARDAHHQHVAEVDLLVIGGPTHAHSMTRPKTRHAAVEQADSHGLTVEDDSEATGVREWLEGLPAMSGTSAAAFDTRVDVAKLLSGQASRAIAKSLRGHGFHLVLAPESFLVDSKTVLLEGERARAVGWGKDLARAITQVLA